MTALWAILGLAAACGGWVLLQRLVARWDPEQPGVEGNRGCHGECERTHCSCGNTPPPDRP